MSCTVNQKLYVIDIDINQILRYCNIFGRFKTGIHWIHMFRKNAIDILQKQIIVSLKFNDKYYPVLSLKYTNYFSIFWNGWVYYGLIDLYKPKVPYWYVPSAEERLKEYERELFNDPNHKPFDNTEPYNVDSVLKKLATFALSGEDTQQLINEQNKK